ncbi:uncharacterized protein LOC135846832 isoform X3 [Planococcus citri]|uniref:uncharacterized protein LOC135846832 isoform X3 n=1 Tax=Planococcus citri TaxID=170843 RepID=UPI0031F82381
MDGVIILNIENENMAFFIILPVELTISAVFRPWAISKFNGYGVKSIQTLQKKQQEVLADRRVEKTVYRRFYSYKLDRWYDHTFKGKRVRDKESLQKAHRKKLLGRRVKKIYKRYYLWFGRIFTGDRLTNKESLKNARQKEYVDGATEEIIVQLLNPWVINDVEDFQQNPDKYLKELKKEEKEKYVVMIKDAIEESFLRMLLDIKLRLDVELVFLVADQCCIDNSTLHWNINTETWASFYERVLINGGVAMEEYYEESIKQDAIVTSSHRLLRNYVLDIWAKRESMGYNGRIPGRRKFSEKSQKFIDFVLRNENCVVK